MIARVVLLAGSAAKRFCLGSSLDALRTSKESTRRDTYCDEGTIVRAAGERCRSFCQPLRVKVIIEDLLDGPEPAGPRAAPGPTGKEELSPS